MNENEVAWMSDVRDRNVRLLEQTRDRIGTDADTKGIYTNQAATMYETIAVVSYLLDEDISRFRCCLVKAAECCVSLYERRNLGDPISSSYTDYYSVWSMLDAACAWNQAVATKLAELKCQSDGQRVESWISGLSTTLVALVLDDRELASKFLRDWQEFVDSRDANFEGLFRACSALANGDERSFWSALLDVSVHHSRDPEVSELDTRLCRPGVGIAAIALSRGMKLPVGWSDERIPRSLLVDTLG